MVRAIRSHASHSWIERRCFCSACSIHIIDRWIFLNDIWFCRAFINIIFKPTLFYLSARKYHLSPSVLNSSHPLSNVYRAICPLHLAFSLTLIIDIASLVLISTGPNEMSVSVLFIILICSFVLIYIVSFALSPFSVTMLESHLKISYVVSSTLPDILPFTIWFSY